LQNATFHQQYDTLVGLGHFQLTQSIWMAFNTLTVASWLLEYFPVIFEPGMIDA